MGWSGGGKILYPGVAGEDTVSYFHLKASLYNENLFGNSASPVRTMREGWLDTIGPVSYTHLDVYKRQPE